MLTRSVADAVALAAASSRSKIEHIHLTLWLQRVQHAAGQRRSLCSRDAVLTHKQQVAGKIGWPRDYYKAISRSVFRMRAGCGTGFREKALVQPLACETSGGTHSRRLRHTIHDVPDRRLRPASQQHCIGEYEALRRFPPQAESTGHRFGRSTAAGPVETEAPSDQRDL